MRNNVKTQDGAKIQNRAKTVVGPWGGSTTTETLHFTVVICVKIIYTHCHNQNILLSHSD